MTDYSYERSPPPQGLGSLLQGRITLILPPDCKVVEHHFKACEQRLKTQGTMQTDALIRV